MRLFQLFLFGCLSLFLVQCEDRIDIDSSFERAQPVVDAWLNDKDTVQEIRLSLSQDYYAASLAQGITDATVRVCRQRDGACFDFIHQAEGLYTWTPVSGGLGQVGDVFDLSIQRGSVTWSANTEMFRVPAIDSISIQFEDEFVGVEDGLYAQIYARDFPGIGDSYWIRSWRNDSLLNRPQELNFAFDATFDPGSGTDGVNFIFPIRFGINKLDDDGAPIRLNSGDEMYVEIHSISNEAFRFWNIAGDQITNGDNTIFAIPLANSPTNISSTDGERVLGFFNVAAVSSARKRVE